MKSCPNHDKHCFHDTGMRFMTEPSTKQVQCCWCGGTAVVNDEDDHYCHGIFVPVEYRVHIPLNVKVTGTLDD